MGRVFNETTWRIRIFNEQAWEGLELKKSNGKLSKRARFAGTFECMKMQVKELEEESTSA